MISGPAAIAALKLVGCTDQANASPENVRKVQASTGAQSQTCTATPMAYVYGAAPAALQAALAAAGFEVAALPLEQSPLDLRGLILIPAFASEDDAYAEYMKLYAEDLYDFVDMANVLVQLTQAKESEQAPPFLPTTHTAVRSDMQLPRVKVIDRDHPLLKHVAVGADGLLDFERADLAVNAFASQDGFDVIMADETSHYPVLMEGAYGQGRIVLSALAFDYTDKAGKALSDAFFTNLIEHVQSVCMRATQALEVTDNRTKAAFTPGSQLIAVMPDTQVYALRLPGLFYAQTSWIREHAQELDIRYALQLGDVTNNNTRTEWQRAAAAFHLLRGAVPWAIAPGNHDYGPSGDATTRDTLLNEYFSFETRANEPGFGGAYETGRLDNTYHLFTIGGRDLILLSLEWGPRNEVIAWANEIMAMYSEREGVLATHAYLNNDDRRYDHTDKKNSQRYNPHAYRTPGGVNDGEELWQKLVRRHRFIMTLNGHVLGDGCGYLASRTDLGNTCHQMLSNYQMRAQGGEGYLRLIEFLPDGKSVRVFTYSALYDKFLDDPKQNFDITLD